jgi:hypothetical protein
MKSVLTITAFFFFITSLFSLPISISPLSPEDEGIPDFSSRLIGAVKIKDLLNTLHITALTSEEPVHSLLDAGITASKERIDYLLYGTLNREENWIEVRISLYERETDRIRTVFYGKSDSSRHNDLIEELAGKICRYFYRAYDIEPSLIQREWQGFWTARFFTGYWGLLSPWDHRLTGLFSLAFKGTLTPPDIVLYMGDFTLFTGFGLYAGYSLGLNKPDNEHFTYHSFQLAFPLDFSTQWRDRHCFSLSLAGGSQIDGLFQSRLYGDLYSALSQTFIVKVDLSYEFLIPESNWFLGFSQEVDFAFYDPLLIGYKPSLSLGYRFPVRLPMASRTQDYVRLSSTSHTQDYVRLSSTSHTQDNVRLPTASHTQDNVRLPTASHTQEVE